MIKYDDVSLFRRFHAAASRDDRRVARAMERVKALYYSTEARDGCIEEALGDLVRHVLEHTGPDSSQERSPGIGVVIAGESGQGKSRIVKHALSANAVFSVPAREGHRTVTLRVVTPKPSSLGSLGLHILDQLGYPMKPTQAHEVWRRVRHRLRHLGVVFIWIDEFQHVIDRRNLQDLRDIRDTLKSLLGNEDWPVYVILSGLPHMVTLLEEPSEDPENDVQALRRYAFMSIPGLSLPDEMPIVKRALRDACDAADLTLALDDEQELCDRLVHAALYRFGLTIELIGAAVSVALLAGHSTLREDHFARMFEKRTGSVLQANPFVAKGWHEIDCKAVLKETDKAGVVVDKTSIFKEEERAI